MIRRKLKTLWLLGTAINAGVTSITPATITNLTLVGNSDINNRLGGQGLLVKILGDIWWDITTNAATVPWPISAGIIRIQVDNTGAPPTALSPGNLTGQTFDWIWQKAWMIPGVSGVRTRIVFPSYAESSASASESLPYWTPAPMINTRARRKLMSGNSVGLYIDASSSPAQVTAINMWANLRVLLRHK